MRLRLPEAMVGRILLVLICAVGLELLGNLALERSLLNRVGNMPFGRRPGSRVPPNGAGAALDGLEILRPQRLYQLHEGFLR